MAGSRDPTSSEVSADQRPQFCPHCGHAAGVGDFCPGCGSRLLRSAATNSADLIVDSAGASAPTTNRTVTNGSGAPAAGAGAMADHATPPPNLDTPAGPSAGFGVSAGAPFGGGPTQQWPTVVSTPPHRSRPWLVVAGAGVAALIVAAVGLVVVMNSSSSNGSAQKAYHQKLATAFAPVLTANTALSSALSSLSGNNTASAKPLSLRRCPRSAAPTPLSQS